MAVNTRTIRAQNALLLVAVEATPGAEVVPSASTNAIKTANLQISWDVQQIDPNEHTGSLDTAAPIVGGAKVSLSFDVLLKGSGAAGTAPEWGKLMGACSWAETITAAAVPVAAEACAAGGTTTTAVLGASASAVAQAYRGMPLLLSGTVAATTFISDYTAGKTATVTDTLSAGPAVDTSYQIAPNVVYRPASVDPTSLTAYVYMDGLLYKLTGVRGDWTLTADAGGVGKLQFKMMGIFQGESDAAVPVPVFDAGQAPVWRGGVMSLDRMPVALQTLTLNSGNNVTNPPNPNQSEGFDVAEILARNVNGSINPKKYLKATSDRLGKFRTGTAELLHARWGTAAGNRIAITLPAAQYTQYAHGNREGAVTTDLNFKAVGADSGGFLCLW